MILPLILLEAIVVIVVMQLMVLGMPQSLRHASEQNCYRMDGTRSKHRSRREQSALTRLRADLFIVLTGVCVIGDVGFLIMESQVASLQTLGSLNWEQVERQSASAPHRGSRVATLESAQHGKMVSGQQMDRYWPLLNGVVILVAMGCFFLLACGAFKAYGSFAEGVKARANEYVVRDLERMRQRDLEFSEQSEPT